MYSVYFTLEKENALINHYIRGVSCTFRKGKKLWILHIKKNAMFKGFFSCFYPLNMFGRAMYSELLKGFFGANQSQSCVMRGKADK